LTVNVMVSPKLDIGESTVFTMDRSDSSTVTSA